MGLKDRLRSMEEGRWASLVDAIEVKEACGECYFFNPNVRDPDKQYRCKVMGSCVAVSVHPLIQHRMYKALGWVVE